MFSRLRSFLATMTRRERFEDSLDEEVRFHLDAYAEDLVRSGVPRREAIRRACIHFGSVEGVKDDCRQARGLRLADEVARDTKHAGRFLRRNPGFGLVTIATLGLGIGATVLVFSIIDAWLFRPLSFPEPDRLTISVYATRERPSEPAVFVLYRDYLSWKERSRSFQAMAAVFPRTYLMGGHRGHRHRRRPGGDRGVLPDVGGVGAAGPDVLRRGRGRRTRHSAEPRTVGAPVRGIRRGHRDVGRAQRRAARGHRRDAPRVRAADARSGDRFRAVDAVPARGAGIHPRRNGWRRRARPASLRNFDCGRPAGADGDSPRQRIGLRAKRRGLRRAGRIAPGGQHANGPADARHRGRRGGLPAVDRLHEHRRVVARTRAGPGARGGDSGRPRGRPHAPRRAVSRGEPAPGLHRRGLRPGAGDGCDPPVHGVESARRVAGPRRSGSMRGRWSSLLR